MDAYTLSLLKIVKLFKDNTAPINSLDFSSDGELVISSSDDESIHIYSTVTGKNRTKVYSKKYGVDLVRFTQTKTRVLSASKNGWDESLRYLSVEDNQYIRYFKGHRDKVTSLSMCPEDDTFISASLDQTVRLWDLRSQNCQGLIRRSGRMVASNDPSGTVFVVLSAINTVSLYDRRNYDLGPFKTWQMDYPPFEWKTVEFSQDGNELLLLTENGLVFLVDSFTGNLLQEFKPQSSNDKIITVSFTPSSQFVFGGSASGKIYAWNNTGKEIFSCDTHLDPAHAKEETGRPINALRWNPRMMMMASTEGNVLHMWLPQMPS
uniref:Uncharacterized protein n=1 Tax=Arcella intermedia TaxID=1963864 RepID=A0A6B2LA70_9EUKA